VGDGSHSLTKVLDHETGEDIGRSLGISSVSYRMEMGQGVLILEVQGPFIIDIKPD
jgi:hypothetical protein